MKDVGNPGGAGPLEDKKDVEHVGPGFQRIIEIRA